MFQRIGIALLGVLLSWTVSATTYTIVGGTFNERATGTYTSSMKITATFETTTPLPANLIYADVGPDQLNVLSTFSVSDGVYTYTNLNTVPLPNRFQMSTDAKGNISGYHVEFIDPPPPQTVGENVNVLELNDLGDSGSPPTYSFAYYQTPCGTVFQIYCSSFGSSTSNAGFSAIPPQAIPNFTALAPTLALDFAPAAITLGSPAVATFLVTNVDTADNVDGLAFTDTLPAGLVLATPNGLATTCTGTVTAVEGTKSIALAGATLGASASCTVSVNVKGTRRGMLSNTTGPVTSSDSLDGNAANAALKVSDGATLPVPTTRQWTLWLITLLLAATGALAAAKRWTKRPHPYA